MGVSPIKPWRSALIKPWWLNLAEVVGCDILILTDGSDRVGENKVIQISQHLNKMGDERKLELIMESADVYDLIAHPTDEMKRLHEVKWKL